MFLTTLTLPKIAQMMRLEEPTSKERDGSSNGCAS